MKKINKDEAKNIALEIFNKLEDESRRDFLLVHSEKVGAMAEFLASQTNIKNEIFWIAAWLHDIGNIISNENHTEHSLTVLKDKEIIVDEVLRDCILNHGDQCVTETLEGKLFQVADKLSIFDIDTLKVFIKHGGIPIGENYINFLRLLSEKGISLLENFEK